MIWTPDLHIRHRSSFKPNDEWYSMVNASSSSRENTDEFKDEGLNCLTGVELAYEVQTSVFCPFDYYNYPFDVQNCMVSFGSRSLDTTFMLYGRNKQYHLTSMYRAVNFDITIKFTNLTHGDTSVIGLDIKLERVTNSYLMEYYIPCIGVILVSEIGFVVPVTAIPGRIGLLVTQFLTLTNLFIHQMVGL